MGKITIALIQMRMLPDLKANLAHAISLIGQASKSGAQIVCLPELFNSEYFAQYPKDAAAKKLAEEIPGRTTQALSEAAKKCNIVLVAGSIFEKSGSKLFNTSCVFDYDGKMLGIYRKMHIPHDESFFEQDYFEPGDSGFRVFSTKYGKIAPLICYDQWFPEAARIVALEGAEIIFYPTAIATVEGIEQVEGNWQEAWENVMRGHAIANGIIVAACNRAGGEGNMVFWGGSFVCDAFGKTIARAGKNEEILIAKIDTAHSKSVREGWRFFHNRRPESYGKLIETK
jgi:predicted amidohydrolase